jgi:cytochrome c-type biogenesis protein CcmH/NrfG
MASLLQGRFRSSPGKTERALKNELSSRPERSEVERSAVSFFGSHARCEGVRAIVFLLLLLSGFSVCRADTAQQPGFPEVASLVQQGRLAEAETKIREQLRQKPSAAGYNLLGMIEGQRKDFANAVAAFQKASRLDPANLETSLSLVHAYLASKRTGDGLRLAAELSQQHKNDAPLHSSLGILLASEGQYKSAQLELEKADALSPETFEILYNLGQTSLRAGDYRHADLVLNRALALKPESPETLYLLAQVLADESRPMDALALLVHAHKIAAENTDIMLLMAQISISQNYFEDAIPLLESAVERERRSKSSTR